MQIPATIAKRKIVDNYEFSATSVFQTHEQAIAAFSSAKSKLCTPSLWTKLIDTTRTKFELTDNKGDRPAREATTDDYIKVYIGGIDREKYNWIHVEQVETRQNGQLDECRITLKPLLPPTVNNSNALYAIARSESVTLIVRRIENLLIAAFENEDIYTGSELTHDAMTTPPLSIATMIGLSSMHWL